eukprot:GFUD01012398.1.p1 GENE.GFUD01012398.1~~GFUD01012398.1.p1  ORF type:complete len:370 (-),score=81.79 GFUD01012398.1:251-1360(-)
MGGNEFESTQRLSEEEKARMCKEIKMILDRFGVNFGFPVEVTDKAEMNKEIGEDKPYGDVDVMIAADDPGKRSEIVELLKNSVGLEGVNVRKNDTTFFFLSKERFQIDLTFCEEKHLQFDLAFKSNNDFGALIGHLLTPLRLKWSNLGLVLKLIEADRVSGIGTWKPDIVLTKDLSKVCSFLAIPRHCLDGKTRMSTREIFEILTRSRIFFVTGTKNKLKKRRKQRPMMDSFFHLLESDETDLAEKKKELFKNDKLEMSFRNFLSETVQYKEYIELISEHFNMKDEVLERLTTFNKNFNSKPKPNQKFSFQTLRSWYPTMEQNMTGKIFSKVYNNHCGEEKDAFEDWINKTAIEDIKLEVEHTKHTFSP